MWKKLEVIPMKKIVVAFIAGALLMLTGQALADTVSQIGKKVDSEAAVYVNGNKVSDAIIIKGKSYAPVRDIVVKLGAYVEWKGSEGIVITNNLVTDEEIAEHNLKNEMYIQAYATAKAKVDGSKREIERLEKSIAKAKAEFVPDTIVSEYQLSRIEKLEQELETEKANLVQYEAKLSELESTK
jgi:hypothetical protein